PSSATGENYVRTLLAHGYRATEAGPPRSAAAVGSALHKLVLMISPSWNATMTASTAAQNFEENSWPRSRALTASGEPKSSNTKYHSNEKHKGGSNVQNARWMAASVGLILLKRRDKIT